MIDKLTTIIGTCYMIFDYDQGVFLSNYNQDKEQFEWKVLLKEDYATELTNVRPVWPGVIFKDATSADNTIKIIKKVWMEDGMKEEEIDLRVVEIVKKVSYHIHDSQRDVVY
jgi:hypothetical protein